MVGRVRTNVGRHWGVDDGVDTRTKGRKVRLACVAAILAVLLGFVSVSHEASHLDVVSAAAPDAPCATCGAPGDLAAPREGLATRTAFVAPTVASHDVPLDAGAAIQHLSRGPPAPAV